MRKVLTAIILILVVVLVGFTMIKGINIGKLQVPSIAQLKEKNEDLDTTVKNATKLASTDYQQKVDELNTALKKLQTEKTNYEDLVNVSTESEIQAANKTYNTIEFLFVRIENHAKSEGVTIKMEVTRSSSGEADTYDLNFTATGTYTGIEEFITAIEDDSKLGFKIEDFSMLAKNTDGNEVEATFVCKNIIIKGVSSSTTSPSTSGTTQVDTTGTSNSTNSTSSNNTNDGNTNSSTNSASNEAKSANNTNE